MFASLPNTPTFPRAIPINEWLSKVKELFSPEPNYITIETSPEDMTKIEELLLVEKGFFSTPYMVKTKMEFCQNCNRRNNFLDVVATGLKVHTPQFLVNVFTGKYGHIINEAPHQNCLCYQCGETLPKEATKYSAPKESSGKEKQLVNSSFPAYTYTYRF